MNTVESQTHDGDNTMGNHPNRSKSNRGAGATPTQAEIIAAREAAGLTQEQAGELVYLSRSGWAKYEAATTDPNFRRMQPQIFEAFLLKTGQASPELYAAIEAARKERK